MKIRFIEDHQEMHSSGGDSYEWCLSHGEYTQFFKGEEYEVAEVCPNGYYLKMQHVNEKYISKIWIKHGVYELVDVESVVYHESILHEQVENKTILFREDIIMSVREVKVGQMPGKIESFAVETGTEVRVLLDMAGLNAEGFEIKADGVTVEEGFTVNASTSMILLVKRVKGNSVKEVKVGQMPGKIESFAVETGTTVSELLSMAGLNADGFEIKVDGRTAPDSTKVTASTSMVLLVKRVKGN